MSKSKVWILLAVIFVSCIVPTVLLSNAQAQELALDQLFTTAMQSNGVEYVNARNAIIEKGTDAIPFLKSKRSDHDWHVRILAAAMLGRTQNPKQYTAYEYQMVDVMKWTTYHVVDFYSLLKTVDSEYINPLDTQPNSSRSNHAYNKHELGIDDAAFLVEVALKGSILKKPTVNYKLPTDDSNATYIIPEVAKILGVDEKLAEKWLRGYSHLQDNKLPKVVDKSDLERFVKYNLDPDTSSAVDLRFQESARCWAMLQLGNCFGDDKIAIPTLVELMQSNSSEMIKGYAALGLGMVGSQDAIDILMQAQNDSDTAVSSSAKLAIGKLNRDKEKENKNKNKDK